MNLRHWIVALGLLLGTGAVHAQTVSLGELARHVEYKDVKISPDGENLAATAVVKGQTVLALIHRADNKIKVISPRDEDDVTDFWWASSKRVIYSVGIRLGGYVTPLNTGELFAVNADGGNPDMLYGYRKAGMSTGSHIRHGTPERGTAQFIAAVPDDPNQILVSVTPWVVGYDPVFPTAYRMNVRTGAKTRIITAPIRDANFVADHEGRIRLAYGVENDGSVKVYRHPVDGDGWQLLPKISAMRSYPMAFSRDDQTAYFACPGVHGGFGICQWKPTAPSEMHEVWSNPLVEPDHLMQGLARYSVAGVAFMNGRPGMALFNGQSDDAKALMLLVKQFAGEKVSIISGTSDGSLSVVRVEADVDPGAFYLFDYRAKKLTLLLSRAPWIHPEQMAGKQPFEFTARDGMKLQGYVSFPSGKEDAKHLPMVVYVHGGPYGIRDRWDYDPMVQAMATRGYAVLQVNYRGSGGYGYGFMRAGWGEWGGKMQDDVTDATHWAISQGIADPNRVCIFGGSYGGYAALEGAVKEPDLYKCAIGYAGIYDLGLMYKRGDIPQSIFGKNYLKRVLGQDMGMLARHSPIDHLDALKARVMLVVGGKDERVPPIQGTELHAALLKRHVAHTWLYKPDEMHGFYTEANNTELYTRLVQFLGANIGPGQTGPHASQVSSAATVH